MLRVCDLVEVQNHSRKDAKIAKELPARENVIVFVQFFAIFARVLSFPCEQCHLTEDIFDPFLILPFAMILSSVSILPITKIFLTFYQITHRENNHKVLSIEPEYFMG